MLDFRCRIGIHAFPWPPHEYPWSLWQDYNIECARGCGARATRTCLTDRHWQDKHPEPVDYPQEKEYT